MTSFLAPLVACWSAGALLFGLDGRKRAVQLVAILALAATLVLDAATAVAVARHGPQSVVAGGWPASVGIALRTDLLGALFNLGASAVLLAVLSHESIAGVRARSFPALVCLLEAGLHGFFSTHDAFSLYVFFELSMVASFVLTSCHRSPPELRATFLYVVANLIGSVVFLIAVAALYHVTGTLTLDAIASRASGVPDGAMRLVGALFVAAFGLKVGLFPFHFWLPVVYRDTCPAIAALLAGALSNAGIYGLLRLGYVIFEPQVRLARPLLVALGAASAIYGALLALGRRDGGEIVAYASVAHAGYPIVALALGGVDGLTAAILLALSGALDKAVMLLSLDLSGSSGRAAAIIGGGSAAGIPPTLGFVSKLLLLRAAMRAPYGPLLVASLVLASAISLAFVFRSFWRAPRGEARARGPIHAIPALALAAGVVALGMAPGPLVHLCRGAAAALLAGAPP
jgi:multicomponent Na+:H+ antiporter subunit D